MFLLNIISLQSMDCCNSNYHLKSGRPDPREQTIQTKWLDNIFWSRHTLLSHLDPFSCLSLTSSLCFCSTLNLAVVAALTSWALRAAVTSFHKFRDSNSSCCPIGLTCFFIIGIAFVSTNTSVLPFCVHLAVIKPFHSPETVKIDFLVGGGLNTSALIRCFLPP